jgi:NitT/TauT family transport system permease protein
MSAVGSDASKHAWTAPSKDTDAAQRRREQILYPLTVGFILLSVWQAGVMAFDVPAYLLPSPWLTLQTLWDDRILLFDAWLNTVSITIQAFVGAVVLGTLISFFFVQSRRIEAAFFPYAVLFQVTPMVAIAPLIIIWVKSAAASMVVCALIIALFPVISNTTIGLRSVNPGLMSYFRMNEATRWQTLMRLRIPSALPYFLAGLRISSGLALIGAVVAEFVAGTGGIGTGLAFLILQAGYQLNIPRMFAALLGISLTGIALFVLMSQLTRVVLGRWHESETNQE